MRVKENYIYIYIFCYSSIRRYRKDSVKWKFDLIIFYFKKEKYFYFLKV